MSCREAILVGERLLSATEDSVLVTLVAVEGSSYRRVGARLLWFPSGERLGGISGGCLEEDVVAHAATVLESGASTSLVYDTTKDEDVIWGTGLGCRGRVTLLLEPVRKGVTHPLAAYALSRKTGVDAWVEISLQPGHGGHRRVLWEAPFVSKESLQAQEGNRSLVQRLAAPPVLGVFGAGRDAEVVVRLASELGWDVLVYDWRPERLKKEFFPAALDRIHTDTVQPLGGRTLPPGAAAVVMSHHYVHDLPWLEALASETLSYVGLLGPRTRGSRILADLTRNSPLAGESLRGRLHSPVGLNLGGDGAEAVALSIVAELQAHFQRRGTADLEAVLGARSCSESRSGEGVSSGGDSSSAPGSQNDFR